MEPGLKAKSVCYRVFTLCQPNTCLSLAPTRAAKPQGQSPAGIIAWVLELYHLTKDWILWVVSIDKSSEWKMNMEPTPEDSWGHLLLRKISAIVFLHSLSREEAACISMALTTSFWKQKRWLVICAVWSYAKVLPGRLWAWPSSNSQNGEDLYWGEGKVT